MEQIKNDQLCVEISALGAEMQSIKDAKGEEYLWYGDAKYWTGRSPVLFPIVGRLFGDHYRLHGQTFEMGQHGFARHQEFTLVAQGPQQVTYALHENEDTLRQADEEELPILSTPLSTFEIAGRVYNLIQH